MHRFFFIGTEAELIKVFPVMLEAKRRGLKYYIIASGQNNIGNSQIFRRSECGVIDLELSQESEINKNAIGLLAWWIRIYYGATKKIQNAFPDVDFKNSQMIVHGDTVSTFMGAQLGHKLGMQVCHIEAGLRSHHFFNPFPEEIDRLLTTYIAQIHFAPGSVPAENLTKVKGKVVNTEKNTLIDSLRFSEKIPLESDLIEILQQDYFVFVMHRQENLIKKEFVCDVVQEVVTISQNRKCVIILHEITKNAFTNYKLIEDLKKNQQIILLPRLDYFDFMKLLSRSKFVITDGGSNQEELFYMGKPCLIIRKTTERTEGLGINARLFNGKSSDIGNFVSEIDSLEISQCISMETAEMDTPSKIIVDTLIQEDTLYCYENGKSIGGL